MLDAQERGHLIQVLEEAGLPAHEQRMAGGVQVIVALFDRNTDPITVEVERPDLSEYMGQAAKSLPEDAYLYIGSRMKGSEQQVGLLANGVPSFDFNDWQTVSRLQEAQAAYLHFWDQRDAYLNEFVGRPGE